ncbi:MAG: DUF3466 family protein [Armatimonadetes bacterium]|nr:DUF3466 family protein [Armatimonadota bacterium]
MMHVKFRALCPIVGTCVGVLLYLSPTLAQTVPRYTLAPLLTPEGASICPYAINSAGQVTGYGPSAGSHTHAFLWDPVEGARDLGDLPGGADWSFAYDLNDHGEVVGESVSADGTHPFFWSPETGMVDLGVLPGCEWGAATGVNNEGIVVGYCATPEHKCRAFLWSPGSGMEDLGELPGGYNGEARAYDINNQGQVVGFSSYDPGDRFFGSHIHAFLWDRDSGMQDLGDLVAANADSIAYAVNKAGEVVGQSRYEYEFGQISSYPFIWACAVGMRPLGVFENTIQGYRLLGGGVANDINDLGQAVGWAPKPFAHWEHTHAVIWDTAGRIHDLNDLLIEAPSGLTLSDALGINNRGQIVAEGYIRGELGGPKGFLLIPHSACSISGVVYQDANHNGGYDPGEGISGVRVCLAPRGEKRPWKNNLYTAITDKEGRYAFRDVQPGKYWLSAWGEANVQFVAQPVAASSEAVTAEITWYPHAAIEVGGAPLAVDFIVDQPLFVWGEDNFPFSNLSSLSSKWWDARLRVLRKRDLLLREVPRWVRETWSEFWHEWRGMCFGFAMCAHKWRLHPNPPSPLGTFTFRCDEQEAINAIADEQSSERSWREALNAYRLRAGEWPSPREVFEAIHNNLRSGRTVVVALNGWRQGLWGGKKHLHLVGHAVLAVGSDEATGVVTIYDPNLPQRPQRLEFRDATGAWRFREYESGSARFGLAVCQEALPPLSDLVVAALNALIEELRTADCHAVVLACPAMLTVTSSSGIVGYVNGKFVCSIAGADVRAAGEIHHYRLPAKGSYVLHIDGTADGSATLSLGLLLPSGSVRSVSFADFPVTQTSQARLELSDPSSPLELQIDEDGDGMYETTLQPQEDRILTPVITLTHEFSAGWHRFSVPLQPSKPSPAEVLARLGSQGRDWLLYDYVGHRFRRYPDPSVRDFALGRGYWLRVVHGGTVEVSGLPADPSKPVTIDLPRGWSIIGCPFNEPVPWDAEHVQIICNGVTQPLNEKSASGRIFPTIYGYKNGRNVPIDPRRAPGSLEPWQGYWICARRPCTLKLTARVNNPAAKPVKAPKRNSSPDNWTIQLIAETNGFGDVCTIGVQAAHAETNAASASAEPLCQPHPPLGPGIGVYVKSAQAREEGSPGNAVDLLNGPVQKASWDIVVEVPQPNAEVVLSWPDLSELPSDLVAYIVDKATGKRQYMRTTRAYRFVSSEAGARREFSIEVVQRRGEGAVVSSLSAAALGRGRAEIVFTLSTDARVDVTIMNIAGRTIRRLAVDRAATAGCNRLYWNGLNDNGAKVPAGRYLVKITSKTQDGYSSQRIAPLSLR